ncbi:hypothetical protein C8D91_0289 [Marinicella litoralis]|uniref:Uncharacterized protein n=2 Tax=Marinicella litoralis TaxID=644220 RepID=A0A4R6Y321_9GAMM|nr:hypothetical protein C8D91_0289 [Marinicella litoralis]
MQQATDEPSFIRQHWLMFSLMVLAVVTFLIGRYSNIDMLNAFKGQKRTWDEVNQQLTAENEQQKKTISLLETEVKIKNQAIAELQKSLDSLTQEKSTLKADLVFYENLLSHKDTINKLRVFDIEIEEQGELVFIKMVLAQKLQKADLTEGTLVMKLTGITEQTGTVIDLVEQYKLDNDYAFKYFEIKKYTISLPKGFNPTTLLVELHGKNKRQKVVSEQFQWSELLSRSQTDLVDEPSANAN